MISVDEMIAFEAEVAAAFNAGRIRAPVHLSGGNELQVREQFLEVRPEDWVATTWRSHYHCLLKGVPRHVLLADILAGKSITLNYPEYRVISSAIVGGVIPIALGVAFAIKRKQGLAKVHCFVGDMTARTGIYHECLQYAQGHSLPIRFVVEDNGKSVCTPTAAVWGDGKDQPPNCIWDGRGNYYKYELGWPHAGAGKRVEF